MQLEMQTQTEAENRAHMATVLRQMRTERGEHREAAQQALAALGRLAKVMKERSGQPYKVRSILYSLWNGKPASMIEIVNLDWAIRKDLCAFMLGFGFEDGLTKCFYTAIQDAVKAAGQWDWFQAEESEVELMRSYVKQAEAK